MQILVQKFGGSSVATLERMGFVQKKVCAALDKGFKVVVVLSARAGDTNNLLDLANQVAEDPDLAELDVLLTTGEQISVALFAMMLKKSGIKARSFLGFQIPLLTDASYTEARIIDIDDKHIRNEFKHYDVVVMAGFQGITPDGRLTTLGRGGSDTSAVAIAAALNSCDCEIYTDVEGVYTTDPNLCSSAKKLDRVSYDEMLEMASMGSKVLQTRSVEFAKKYKVPVHVRSTFSDAQGTLVTQEDPQMEAVLVSGIAYDKDQVRITLRDVPDQPGVASSIFVPLSDANILVDMIVQNPSRNGLTDMTFTIPKKQLKKTLPIMEAICAKTQAKELLHDQNVAKVSIIGVGMRSHSGVAAAAFSILKDEGINIMMISTSEIKITCLIEEKYVELAVRTLHDAFGLSSGEECS